MQESVQAVQIQGGAQIAIADGFPQRRTTCSPTPREHRPLVLPGVPEHPQVEHWAVLVITPHSRLKLGPTQALQPSLDPLLNLLTLPIRPESELQTSTRQILANRPDLDKSKSW